jgi:signal transduction histidine kinase
MEALNNALKHARATRVTVRVWEDAGGIAMEIKDDGVGLESPVRQGGIGLHSMAERAQRLGGAVTVSGGVRAGTCICVHLPATAPVLFAA